LATERFTVDEQPSHEGTGPGGSWIDSV